jgi:hypothetical protein
MSRWAIRVSRTSKRRERRSGTLPPGSEFGGRLFSKSIDDVVDFLAGAQRHIVAALDVVESFLGGGAKPRDLGLVFPLALLQEAEALADDLARVAEAAGSDASLHAVVKIQPWWSRLSTTIKGAIITGGG